MKRLAVIFLVLYGNHTYATDSTIVKFMTSIYKQVIDSSYRYYYVLDEAKNPKFDVVDKDNFKRSVPKEFKDIPFDDFLTVISIDTSRFKWSYYPLPNARYVDRTHLPRNVGLTKVFKYVPINTQQTVIDSLEKTGVIPIPIKPKISAKKAEQLIKRWTVSYNKRPKEEKNFYVFSKPIFTANKQYALIDVDEVGQGCTYVFRNHNGQWLIVAALSWIA